MSNEDLWVVIPTATRRQYIPGIIEKAGISKEKIVIVHTIPDNPFYDDVTNIICADGLNIHRWWNRGLDYVTSKGGRYVAVLNDDVLLEDDPLNKIASTMKATGAILGYPYPFQGWVCGYCWIIDLASDIRPDENYKWWYGDRDLDLQAHKLGPNMVVHVPAKVRHLEGNILTSQSQELMDLTKIDEELFFSKWNLQKA